MHILLFKKKIQNCYAKRQGLAGKIYSQPHKHKHTHTHTHIIRRRINNPKENIRAFALSGLGP